MIAGASPASLIPPFVSLSSAFSFSFFFYPFRAPASALAPAASSSRTHGTQPLITLEFTVVVFLLRPVIKITVGSLLVLLRSRRPTSLLLEMRKSGR